MKPELREKIKRSNRIMRELESRGYTALYNYHNDTFVVIETNFTPFSEPIATGVALDKIEEMLTREEIPKNKRSTNHD